MKRKRAQDIKMYEFLPLVKTTEGPNEALKDEVARKFSTPTDFLMMIMMFSVDGQLIIHISVELPL